MWGDWQAIRGLYAAGKNRHRTPKKNELLSQEIQELKEKVRLASEKKPFMGRIRDLFR